MAMARMAIILELAGDKRQAEQLARTAADAGNQRLGTPLGITWLHRSATPPTVRTTRRPCEEAQYALADPVRWAGCWTEPARCATAWGATHRHRLVARATVATNGPRPRRQRPLTRLHPTKPTSPSRIPRSREQYSPGPSLRPSEGSAERVRRAVSDRAGDRLDRLIGVAEPDGRQVDAPLRHAAPGVWPRRTGNAWTASPRRALVAAGQGLRGPGCSVRAWTCQSVARPDRASLPAMSRTALRWRAAGQAQYKWNAGRAGGRRCC